MSEFISKHTGTEIDLAISSGSTTSGVIKDFNTLSGSSTSTLSLGGSSFFGGNITSSGNISASGDIFGGSIILGPGAGDSTLNVVISGSDGHLVVQGNKDGGDVNLVIRNSAAGGSTDETTSLIFSTVDGNKTPAIIRSGREQVYTGISALEDGFLSFLTQLNGSVGERMRITSDGSVAIGTTTPTDTFHVEGNITASGGLTLNKTTVSSDAASSSGNLTSNNFSLSHVLTLDGNLADDAEHADVTITTNKCKATSVVVGSSSLKVQVFVHTVTNGSFKFFFVNKSGGTLADDSTIRFNFTIL